VYRVLECNLCSKMVLVFTAGGVCNDLPRIYWCLAGFMVKVLHKHVPRPAAPVGYDVSSSSGMRRDKLTFILILISLSVIKVRGQTRSGFKVRWRGWWLIPRLFNAAYSVTQVNIKWKVAEVVCFKRPYYNLHERTEKNQEILSE
jgi:hypothetical protein